MSVNPGAWRTVALMILAGSFMLSRCKRPQASGKPPLPEVAVVVVKAEPTELTVELPGRTSACLNVLDAERPLYAAQQGLIAVRLARLTNMVRLCVALGGGA